MSLKKLAFSLTLAVVPALLWLGLPTPAAAAPAPTELKKLDTDLGLQAKKGHKGKHAGTKGHKGKHGRHGKGKHKGKKG